MIRSVINPCQEESAYWSKRRLGRGGSVERGVALGIGHVRSALLDLDVEDGRDDPGRAAARRWRWSGGLAGAKMLGEIAPKITHVDKLDLSDNSFGDQGRPPWHPSKMLHFFANLPLLSLSLLLAPIFKT